MDTEYGTSHTVFSEPLPAPTHVPTVHTSPYVHTAEKPAVQRVVASDSLRPVHTGMHLEAAVYTTLVLCMAAMVTAILWEPLGFLAEIDWTGKGKWRP